jgi:hypothetical protein
VVSVTLVPMSPFNDERSLLHQPFPIERNP